MKISIVHRRDTEGVIDQTTVDMEHEGYTPAAQVALAMLAGVRFDSYQLESLLGYRKLDISASGDPFEEKRRYIESLELPPAPARRRIVDFDALDKRAQDAAKRQGSFAFDEADTTGENILALVEKSGGTAAYTVDKDGVIDEIHASFGSDYEYAEGAEVLESLQATGTPHTVVGDFAQTSIIGAGGQEQVLGLAEWSISWKRKTVETTNTDNALYETSLGSTKSWTAKAKYMFLVGDTSQSDAITSAIDTSALQPLVFNFFPNINTGDPAFQGQAIVDGIDISSGSGKVVGLDVSLKGTGPLLRKVQAAPVANSNTVTGQSAQVTA